MEPVQTPNIPTPDIQIQPGPVTEKPVESGKKKGIYLSKTFVFIVILVFILLAGGAIFYFGYLQGTEKVGIKKENETSLPSKFYQTPAPMETISQPEKIIDSGVTWQTPVKLGDLNLFQNKSSSEDAPLYKGTDYYQVGSLENGSKLIMAVVRLEGMGEYKVIHRFLAKDNKYYRIVKNSSKIDDYIYIPNGYEEDQSTVFQSLLPENMIIQGSTVLTHQEYGSWEFDSGFKNGSKVGTTKWGDLYLEIGGSINDSGDQVWYGSYYIMLVDSSRYYYEPKPLFIRDDGTFDINWKNTNGQLVRFAKMATGGCGLGAGSFPLIKKSSNTFEEVGESVKGSKVYSITNSNDPLIVYGYHVYTIDQQPNKKPIEDFAKDLGMVFWTDDFGTTIVFSNQLYVPAVECAKPVIYLYPKKETEVTVEIGAQIWKSEPAYQGEWRVTAQPGGNLIVNKQSYPYLFWDGLGWGEYPEVTGGLVVEKNEVEQTITSQLGYIGLNAKEIDDFLEYWLPLMPQTPYVRLTWFQNEELNKLTPLKVIPQPKTAIRVFLDFEGLENSIRIPAQKLEKMARVGFTLVEWGGLKKGKN